MPQDSNDESSMASTAAAKVVVMTIVVTMTGIAAACLIAAWILDCRGK
jgi:hypothetical protein